MLYLYGHKYTSKGRDFEVTGLLSFGLYMQLGLQGELEINESGEIWMQQTQNSRYENYRLDSTQLGAQHVATWFRPTWSGRRPSSGLNDTKVGDLGS